MFQIRAIFVHDERFPTNIWECWIEIGSSVILADAQTVVRDDSQGAWARH